MNPARRGAAARAAILIAAFAVPGCLFGPSDGSSGGEDTPRDQIFASRQADFQRMETWSAALGMVCADCHARNYQSLSESGEVARRHAEVARSFEVDCAYCHVPGDLTAKGQTARRDMGDPARSACAGCHGPRFAVTRR